MFSPSHKGTGAMKILGPSKKTTTTNTVHDYSSAHRRHQHSENSLQSHCTRYNHTPTNNQSNMNPSKCKFFAALFHGDLESTERILQHEPELVNQTDESMRQWYPLGWASFYGKLEAVRLLLKYDAIVNARDISGQTPLCLAISENHPAVVKELLRHNADTNVRDSFGDSPLFIAVARHSPKIVELLIEHGADTAAHDKAGNTPIGRAVSLQSASCQYTFIRSCPQIWHKLEKQSSIKMIDQ